MGTKCWRGEQYKEHKHNFVTGKIVKKEERQKRNNIYCRETERS
jgi:hypothetical protein